MRRARVLANVRIPGAPRRATPPPGAAPKAPPPRAPWLPPLSALHAFEAAGRHLSFKAAAAELCVTPSAISRQIKLLEELMGVALFLRMNRALCLTTAGAEYLEVVRSAFASLAAGTGAVRAVVGRAVVRVSMVQPLAANWLVPRLPAFAARHPDVEIQILTSLELADVLGGEVDLAIRFGQGSWPGLRAHKLLPLTLFPVCSPKVRQGPPALRRVSDLARHRWLHLSSYPQAFQAWLAHAGARDLASDHHLTFDNADVLFRAAEQGLGVAIATGILVAPYLEAGRLVRPFAIECAVAGAYYLVARADLARERAAATVHRWLLETALDVSSQSTSLAKVDA
jgi:LysR family glycine cleavage system transcriptional activator